MVPRDPLGHHSGGSATAPYAAKCRAVARSVAIFARPNKWTRIWPFLTLHHSKITPQVVFNSCLIGCAMGDLWILIWGIWGPTRHVAGDIQTQSCKKWQLLKKCKKGHFFATLSLNISRYVARWSLTLHISTHKSPMAHPMRHELITSCWSILEWYSGQ